MTNALNFAKEITEISIEDPEIMYHARKSLLFSNEKPWMKREGNLLTSLWEHRQCQRLRIARHFMLNKIS